MPGGVAADVYRHRHSGDVGGERENIDPQGGSRAAQARGAVAQPVDPLQKLGL